MKNKFPQEFLLTILIACMLMISFASVNAQTTEIQAEAGAGRNTDEVYTDINPVYHRNPLKAEKKGYNFHAPIINPIVDNKNLIDTKYSQGDTGNTGPSSPINQQNLVIEKKGYHYKRSRKSESGMQQRISQEYILCSRYCYRFVRDYRYAFGIFGEFQRQTWGENS